MWWCKGGWYAGQGCINHQRVGWGTVSNVLKGDEMKVRGGEQNFYKGESMLGKGIGASIRSGCDPLTSYGAHFRPLLSSKFEITEVNLKS